MCMLCKCDTVRQSTTTHVVNYNGSVIIIKNVPCEQCEQCGEIFYTDEVAEPNVFAIGAAIAAFTKGEDWLEELRAYLFENRAYMTDYIRKEIPQLKVTEADATYLLWLDCSALGCSAKELADAIRKTTGLYVSEGAQYGKTGEQFLRINLACQRSRIADGCERLKRGVEAYRNQK